MSARPKTGIYRAGVRPASPAASPCVRIHRYGESRCPGQADCCSQKMLLIEESMADRWTEAEPNYV